MSANADQPLQDYRTLLKFMTERIRLDPRLEGRFDSSDLVQETLLKVEASMQQLNGLAPPQKIVWLQKALNQALADEWRKATAEKRDFRLEQSLHTVGEDSVARLEAFLADQRQQAPDARLEREELLRQLAQAMNQLPDDQRDAMILRYLHGASVSQIAGQFGRTEKSIAGLLSRGRNTLREILDGD